MASAVIALLIGQTGKPAAPLSAVVYLSPADEQMIKVMHEDEAALLERLRSQPQVQTAPAAVPSTPAAETSVAAAPPKSGEATSTRRAQKPDRAMTIAKRRADARPAQSPISKPAQVITLASDPVATLPGSTEPQSLPARMAAAADADWLSTLKQIPAWFWPPGGGLFTEAPRPPLPVGNFLSRML